VLKIAFSRKFIHSRIRRGTGRAFAHPCPKIGKRKYFSGKNHVKFGLFVNFSGKYWVKLGYFLKFFIHIYQVIMFCPPKVD